MKKFLILVLVLFAHPGFSASTISLPDLTNAPEEDSMVCYNNSSGALGNCPDSASGKPGRIAWVSQDGGGDYDDPNLAMADIDTWCPDRSQSSPCLIRMAPGTWTMGDTPIVLLSDVHIQGSGGTPLQGYTRTALTTIKGTVTGSDTGVIESRSGGSLRDLVVINESTGTYGIAIYVEGGSWFYINEVRALTQNALYSYGLKIESTPSVQTAVSAYNSHFEGGFGDATYARGVYMYSDEDISQFALFLCDTCTFKANGSTNQYGLYLYAANSGATSATIKQSSVSLIKSNGNGSRSLTILFSELTGLELNAGTSVSCAFLRSGATSYTSTCP